ncbi:hypothetical protein Pst134EA_013479 [Puccinia striiformis f. sp. tritici]|uniref:hypothetical protein n=1 Tax=Puccinia striiformis f. sp. tritici TaxID=168172 RepID=UPI002008D455|nr:hypothetical protein Pst134EA_013479 [Puccinia striiformis f. sp. tritici]KAH9465598.1 hypothetical protein Pst134EA_013479 [Puccinia striiformis f. sp. tritici]
MTSSTSASTTEFISLILNRFFEVQNIRAKLLIELDTALDNHINPVNQEKPEQQQEQEQEVQDTPSVGGCRHEYKDIKTNPEDYIQQVQTHTHTIPFDLLTHQITHIYHFLKDLAELIEEVETLESEKISEFLQETLLRRREGLEGRDYAEPIEKHKQRGRELTKSIVNLTAEIRAEMAEL